MERDDRLHTHSSGGGSGDLLRRLSGALPADLVAVQPWSLKVWPETIKLDEYEGKVYWLYDGHPYAAIEMKLPFANPLLFTYTNIDGYLQGALVKGTPKVTDCGNREAVQNVLEPGRDFLRLVEDTGFMVLSRPSSLTLVIQQLHRFQVYLMGFEFLQLLAERLKKATR
jgi:hypothetical protein